MTRLAMFSLLSILGCADETVSGFADPDAVYRLQSIDGAEFSARATIRFPEEGKVSGDAPCNRYSATQSVPYPWFDPGPILATKRACPALAEESVFFAALGEMTLAEVQGEVLILSNDAGREMVFEVE